MQHLKDVCTKLAKTLFCAHAVFIILPSSGATDERKKMTLQFAEAWASDALVQVVAKQCRTTNSGIFDPKSAYKKEPESFGGVSPDSKLWPEVEVAYAKFQTRMCSQMTPTDLLMLYADIMTSELSDDELRGAVAFFTSSAGKQIVKASARANEEFMRRYGENFQKLATEMWSQTRSELMAIAERHKSNPQ
jgi:Uncharacterized protein conserved in bacteria (DUF2059)